MLISGFLRRYTSVLAALDTLKNRRISLLSPQLWDDRNDREVMAHYAATTASSTVFAYCMAEGNETAHHWQVFADRGRGACIKFDRGRLLQALAVDPVIRHHAVDYVNWRELGPFITNSETLPFIKRQVFGAEREYRLIATPAAGHTAPTYEVPIPLTCITSVAISGEAPARHFETLAAIIREIPGCRGLRVRHSGLLRNANWSNSLTQSASPSGK
jgi:hypothetical protein